MKSLAYFFTVFMSLLVSLALYAADPPAAANPNVNVIRPGTWTHAVVTVPLYLILPQTRRSFAADVLARTLKSGDPTSNSGSFLFMALDVAHLDDENYKIAVITSVRTFNLEATMGNADVLVIMTDNSKGDLFNCVRNAIPPEGFHRFRFIVDYRTPSDQSLYPEQDSIERLTRALVKMRDWNLNPPGTSTADRLARLAVILGWTHGARFDYSVVDLGDTPEEKVRYAYAMLSAAAMLAEGPMEWARVGQYVAQMDHKYGPAFKTFSLLGGDPTQSDSQYHYDPLNVVRAQMAPQSEPPFPLAVQTVVAVLMSTRERGGAMEIAAQMALQRLVRQNPSVGSPALVMSLLEMGRLTSHDRFRSLLEPALSVSENQLKSGAKNLIELSFQAADKNKSSNDRLKLMADRIDQILQILPGFLDAYLKNNHLKVNHRNQTITANSLIDLLRALDLTAEQAYMFYQMFKSLAAAEKASFNMDRYNRFLKDLLNAHRKEPGKFSLALISAIDNPNTTVQELIHIYTMIRLQADKEHPQITGENLHFAFNFYQRILKSLAGRIEEESKSATDQSTIALVRSVVRDVKLRDNAAAANNFLAMSRPAQTRMFQHGSASLEVAMAGSVAHALDFWISLMNGSSADRFAVHVAPALGDPDSFLSQDLARLTLLAYKEESLVLQMGLIRNAKSRYKAAAYVIGTSAFAAPAFLQLVKKARPTHHLVEAVHDCMEGLAALPGQN